MIPRADWEYEPVGPCQFHFGMVDRHGQFWGAHAQFAVTLERGVQLLAGRLPSDSLFPEATHCSIVRDSRERNVLAYIGRDHEHAMWTGCRRAFEVLSRYHDPLEVVMFELEAQRPGILWGKA